MGVRVDGLETGVFWMGTDDIGSRSRRMEGDSEKEIVCPF
jgi:hypothetical protein